MDSMLEDIVLIWLLCQQELDGEMRDSHTCCSCLQPGPVDDLIVHSKLAATIIDDQHANTAASIGK